MPRPATSPFPFLPLLLFGLAALLALTATGCASLRPYASVRAGLPAERFLEVDGHQVYVEQSGAGEPVVLLHGFGASTYLWRKVAPVLAESHRVIALDLNGFGYTERPKDPSYYTREGQERTILGVLDRLGIERAHFIGHSYGGGITLFVAARHPERVRSIVLVDSTAPIYPEARRSRAASSRTLDGLFARLLVLRPAMIRRSLRGSFHDDSLVTPELVRAYLERLKIQGVGDAYYGLSAPNPAPVYPVDLAKIGLPSLFVWGAEDTLVKADVGRQIAARLPGSRFHAIEGAGHVPMEEKPEELLAVVLPFLREHGSAGGR